MGRLSVPCALAVSVSPLHGLRLQNTAIALAGACEWAAVSALCVRRAERWVTEILRLISTSLRATAHITLVSYLHHPPHHPPHRPRYPPPSIVPHAPPVGLIRSRRGAVNRTRRRTRSNERSDDALRELGVALHREDVDRGEWRGCAVRRVVGGGSDGGRCTIRRVEAHQALHRCARRRAEQCAAGRERGYVVAVHLLDDLRGGSGQGQHRAYACF